jgi:MoaA/NifB/PqqE/SkfB family radical SAM enzyme
VKLYKILKYSKRAPSVPINLIKRHLLKPLPIIQFNFEVTRRCNGRCVYCNIWRSQSLPEDELKPDEIREYFKPKELFERVESIGVTGGEPFLRNDLVDLCHALKEVCPNANLGLVTNGLLPERVIKTMVQLRDEVEPKVACGVSIDGFAESDSITRGDKSHYYKAWKTVELLKENNFSVGIGSTLVDANIEDAVAFKKYVESKGINYAFEIASESEHYYKNNGLRILDKKYLPIIKELAKDGKTFRRYQPKYFEKPRQIFPCFSGFCSFFLNCYGEVYPCIHLNESYGNLREKAFTEIWYGEKAKNIRRVIRDKGCHCWTACEAGVTIRMLIYPALIIKVIR